MDRKAFLKTSALATASLYIPGFLTANHFRIPYQGKRLIVVQLSGGNDGLNTVIPYGLDAYYQNRPKIGIPADKIISLNHLQGLHPAIASFKTWFDNGEITIMNAVGYPNPDRSHFRSMDIWQSGSSSKEYWDTGWLGRYLDNNCMGCENPWQAIELDDALSLALKGKKRNGFASKTPDKLVQQFKDPFMGALTNVGETGTDSHLHYLYKVLADTRNSAEYLLEKQKGYKPTATYPNYDLSKQFKLIASLIGGGSQTSVFYASLNGFDTHAQQLASQNRRLEILAQTLQALVEDLKKMGAFEDTVIMVFSEFGRRVKENGSGGTDHGTANNLFLIGKKLAKPGLYNSPPSLTDLDDGDLKFTIDFRDIYAEILEKWLGADSANILKRKSNSLGLFKV